jgi:uncharacterized membrane protein YkvA (DUF1232 family)
VKSFDELLKEDIGRYEGRHDDLIFQAPALYRLLVSLLDDPRFPNNLRPLISCAIAYFILPGDVIPESLHGPYGYVDDIWLAAWVVDHVRQHVADHQILVENWDGESDVNELVAEIITKEKELIGDQAGKIRAYCGCDQVVARSEQK